MSDFHKLRNKFVIGAAATSVVGVMCWFAPNSFLKTIGTILGCAGVGGVVVSQLITDESERIAERTSNKSYVELNDLKLELQKRDNELSQLSKVSQKYKTGLEEYRALCDKQKNENQLFSACVAQSNAELMKLKSEFDERLTNVLQVDSLFAVEFLEDCLNIFTREIEGLIKATRYHYPDLDEKMTNFEPKVNSKVEEFKSMITVLSGYETCKEVVGGAIAIQHEIIYHLGVIKGNIYQAQLHQLKLVLEETLPIEEHNEIIDNVNALWTQKYNNLAGNLESIRQEFSSTANQVIEAYNTDYKEMIGVGLSDVEKIEKLQLEILRLQQEILELRKPLQFVGGSKKSDNGNSIINYYYKRGICLDAFDWEETERGFKLYFYVGRNGGKFINEEMLNEENNPEKIRDLTESLNNPEFKRSTRGGHMVLEIITTRPKASTKDEIDTLWIPASKFESYVRRWERVRITAGSTGGKSPTAKNLALAIMNARKGKGSVKLYDPQHGSKKDFWNMPKAGTSHEDNVTGIKELCTLLDERSKSKANHPFILYIFDEIDSTIAKHRSEAYAVKDLVVYSLSQGSHQDLGVIYIGQSADANTIPGMSHSQWNNAVQLHIGSNAGIWLDKATTLTSEDKTKLLQKYRKIQEYCDRMNEESGLDIYEDAGAYRFALAVPLNGLPKFIQLPPFDTYEYDDVMSTNTQRLIFPNNSEWIEIQHPDEVFQSKITCPHCGSEQYRSKGERWLCLNSECSKTWLKKSKS